MGRQFNRIEFPCEVCGVIVSVPASRAKAGRLRYCSTACAKLRQSGSGNGNWKGGLLSRTCLICGTGFQVKRKDTKNGGGKYCSRPCSVIGITNTLSGRRYSVYVEKTCVICGKVKEVKPSHADIVGTYCSVDCMRVGYVTRQLGENNPNYKGAGYTGYAKYSAQRRQLRRLARQVKSHTGQEWLQLKLMYNNTCPCCHRNDVRLTKDHIVPITKGGHDGIDNIQPLCSRCNVKKFTKTIVYPCQLLIPIQ